MREDLINRCLLLRNNAWSKLPGIADPFFVHNEGWTLTEAQRTSGSLFSELSRDFTPEEYTELANRCRLYRLGELCLESLDPFYAAGAKSR